MKPSLASAVTPWRTPQRVLIVKLTSMGDVVHALPAVTDMALHCPGIEIDWVVEAPFAGIPALHPAVQRVIPQAWRRWRRHLTQRSTWQAMRCFREALREKPYDLVLDLQGLLKSAVLGRLARGPLVGYDHHSAREPIASSLYARRLSVPRHLQAVQRCRQLVAGHVGYPLPNGMVDFGLQVPPTSIADWTLPAQYAVLVIGASRPEKLWPESAWVHVGQFLRAQGLKPVVLWGSSDEAAAAQRIAHGCQGEVPPYLSVLEAASVLSQAQIVVGLDTGFSHLAAALDRPTLGIYCDHEPGLAGITGRAWTCSLGGKGLCPGAEVVITHVGQALSASAQLSSMRLGGYVSQPWQPGHCQK